MTASAGGGVAGSTTGGSGEFVVPNQDRCAPGDGEVLAVDVAVPILALDEGYLYMLASVGSVSGASLELSRVPLPRGPVETLVTQDLYGFGLGVQGGVVAWGARQQLVVEIDEDYADWDVWTLDTSVGEPSRLIQGNVMDLSLAPAGVVISRFEPGRLELHAAEGITPLCPAFGVNVLQTNSEVAVWNTFRGITVCPLDGGEAIQLDLNGEVDPKHLGIDAQYAYWVYGDDPGLWRAPLVGGAPELVLPELEGSAVRVVGERAYVVATGSQRIDAIDLSSGAIETIASTEGAIAGLTVDESHAYWTDYVGQWICVKRAPLSP
jgi:hypothetical protein